MSIDFLLFREYDRKTYNCLHFAAEAWEFLTGDARLRKVKEGDFRAGKLSTLFRGMRRHDRPTVKPSLVLMETMGGEAHIGVCLRRRLLHIDDSGPQFFLVEAMTAMYKNMRFYS